MFLWCFPLLRSGQEGNKMSDFSSCLYKSSFRWSFRWQIQESVNNFWCECSKHTSLTSLNKLCYRGDIMGWTALCLACCIQLLDVNTATCWWITAVTPSFDLLCLFSPLGINYCQNDVKKFNDFDSLIFRGLISQIVKSFFCICLLFISGLQLKLAHNMASLGLTEVPGIQNKIHKSYKNHSLYCFRFCEMFFKYLRSTNSQIISCRNINCLNEFGVQMQQFSTPANFLSLFQMIFPAWIVNVHYIWSRGSSSVEKLFWFPAGGR